MLGIASYSYVLVYSEQELFVLETGDSRATASSFNFGKRAALIIAANVQKLPVAQVFTGLCLAYPT